MNKFNSDLWQDCGCYWLSKAVQGSTEWLALRTNMLTASDFGAAVGYSNFATPLEVALDRSAIKSKEFSQASKIAMAHGTNTENKAREYYIKLTNKQVQEVGLAKWKQNLYLGASLDGDIGEGMIEIKCPIKMYTPLLYRQGLIPSKNVIIADPKHYNPTNYAHIWPTHFAQMQGCMAICGKKYCDYVVYTDKQVYIECIPFVEEYWQNLHSKLEDFIDTMLIPAIAQKKYMQENGLKYSFDE